MSETTDKYSGVTNFGGKEEHFSEFEVKLIALLETKDLEEYALADMKVKKKDIAKSLKFKDPDDPE